MRQRVAFRPIYTLLIMHAKLGRSSYHRMQYMCEAKQREPARGWNLKDQGMGSPRLFIITSGKP